MLKKCFSIIVGVMLVTTLFASDVTLLKNPYGIVSLYLQSENYSSPMAHPDYIIETINIDNHAQQLVNFSDLFTDSKKALQIMANYSQAYFLKKLQAENLPKENFNLRESMIFSGTAEKLENYKNWLIVSGYLRIIFERAQIAPSYYGEQTIDIPLSLLTSVLNKKLFHVILQSQENNSLIYTEEKPVVVVSSQQPEFTLKLKSNPTTGFGWYLQEYNPDLLEPVNQINESPKDKKIMGAARDELWTFRVKPSAFVVPMQTTIRLIYIRPWEKSDAAKSVTFKISTHRS